MIDYTQDYTELLQYQNLLDTSNPTEAGGTPWVEECLSKVGWKKGDPIPGGMGEYVAAILDHLKLKKTSKNVKDIFNIDEVKASVQGAIRAVYEVKHADEVAKEKAKELMGDNVDFSNPLMKKLYDAAVRASEKAIKENVQPDQETKVISPEEANTVMKDTAAIVITQAEEKKSEPVNSVKICPCCGIDLTQPYEPVKITDADKRAYLMHVVGGARFYKEFPLWGGMATVILQTTTPEEEELFNEYYSQYTSEYRSTGDFNRLTQHYQKCRLAVLLKEITFTVPNTPPIKSPGIMSDLFKPEEGKTRLQTYIEKWYDKTIVSLPLQTALNGALESYLKTMSELQQCLNDKDFWSGGIAR